MKVNLRIVLVLFVGLAMASGCKKPEEADNGNGDGGGDGGEVNTNGDDEPPAHEHGDALEWVWESLVHEPYVIALGHHGSVVYADHDVEPAVMVTRDDEPVADALVFVTLLDAAGENVIAEEQPTVYEPKTDKEPAHYAQAEVHIPADATGVTLRYRITFPEAVEFSQNVEITVVKH